MDTKALLARGEVWYNIPGKNSSEYIENFINAIKIPASLDRLELLQACLRRESNSSTAMGQALAFPHPGIPMVKNLEDALIAVSYPRFPVDWKAPDDKPVKAVFLIISQSRNEHLSALSALAKLCEQERFYKALMEEAPLKTLLELIKS